MSTERPQEAITTGSVGLIGAIQSQAAAHSQTENPQMETWLMRALSINFSSLSLSPSLICSTYFLI